MLTLHIANKNYSSWSLRPWVLLRQLGIPFTERIHPFAQPGEPSTFTTFSPTGKVPCLQDGELTVWDSLAIAEYLAEDHPAVWPAERSARAFARSACAEMHSGFPTLREHCSMNCALRVRLFDYPPALAADWKRMESLWQEGLTRFGGPFLAGREFTAADAFFAPVAFRVQSYTPPLSGDSLAYVDRLLALPAMQTWYAEALAERWRDEAHEADTLAVGEVLRDLRLER